MSFNSLWIILDTTPTPRDLSVGALFHLASGHEGGHGNTRSHDHDAHILVAVRDSLILTKKRIR